VHLRVVPVHRQGAIQAINRVRVRLHSEVRLSAQDQIFCPQRLQLAGFGKVSGSLFELSLLVQALSHSTVNFGVKLLVSETELGRQCKCLLKVSHSVLNLKQAISALPSVHEQVD